MNRPGAISLSLLVVVAIAMTLSGCVGHRQRPYYQVAWRELGGCTWVTTQYPRYTLLSKESDSGSDARLPRLFFNAVGFGSDGGKEPYVWMILEVPGGYTVQFLSRDVVVLTDHGAVQHVQQAHFAEIDSGKGMLFHRKERIDFLEPMVGATQHIRWDLELGSWDLVIKYIVHVEFPGVRATEFDLRIPDFTVNGRRYSLDRARYTELLGDPGEFVAGKSCNSEERQQGPA